MTMNNGAGVQPGDVVQIRPEHNPVFGGCVMIVEKVMHWGVSGYVDPPGHAWFPFRCPHGDFAVIGRAHWVAAYLDDPSGGATLHWTSEPAADEKTPLS
jgi:hypothetical protein